MIRPLGDRRTAIAEPCSAQGARVAGERYAARHPGKAYVLSHSGAPEARWWLVAVLDLAEAHALYEKRLAALESRSREAICVWFDGRALRFGEMFQGTASRA
jgi:hypothetical protein